MKRLIAPLMILALAAGVWVGAATQPIRKVETTTNPAEPGKLYLTAEVVPNPEVEAIVKSLPAALIPPPKDTNETFMARGKALKEWMRANAYGKPVKVEVVVLSDTVSAFRIAGMEDSLIVFSGKFGDFKKADHAIIEGKLRNLHTSVRNGLKWFQFTTDEAKVSPVPKAAPQ